MVTRMLIDARHPEETRVAVVHGNRIEEFDFESAARRQIKGNIYLAKVTRVEPSLQAAFVDYGGNRHGFLAFSEIHPDYYQIPKEDRDALLREEQQLIDDAGREFDDEPEAAGAAAGGEAGEAAAEGGEPAPAPEEHGPEEHGNAEEAGAEALRRRRMALRRRYKIQEVIRRRQVVLVQVVKEERGNKGAALTTYISLAGRYSVLMPNTANGGGISRKIANATDRKRLKAIMADIALPPSMGVIVRTAGLERTPTEIRRDFDYLARLWDEIRERTLSSQAPALIYEDSDLIKRAIRDIYSRDIDGVLVDGAEGFAQARDYMTLLMPSHARKVELYSDPVPLFHRAGVEAQLSALMSPVVQLRSGGYIVINPTEALVAIDVNSGRSTREFNIEETALKTNIEAAEEVARQLRLRDLAGLVVVDFIDMDSSGNNRKVERALKEALRHDRARIQVGRISAFGLLEMSRQRLRTGVLEASTETCPMCDGLGLVRTPGSATLATLRLLEEEAIKGRATHFRLRADKAVAVYMLNRKRTELAELEDRYGIRIDIIPDETLIGGRTAIEASGPPPAEAPRHVALAPPPRIEDDEEEDADGAIADRAAEGEGDRDPGRRRRRRGGRGRHGDEAATATAGAEPAVADTADEDAEPAAMDEEEPYETAHGEDQGEPRRRRRRRRRGGRRDGGETEAPFAGNDEETDDLVAAEPEPEFEPVAALLSPDGAHLATVDAAPALDAPGTPAAAAEPVGTEEAAAATPAPRRRRAKAAATTDEGAAPAADAGPAPRRRRARANAGEGTPVAPLPDAEAAAPPRRRRRTRAETEAAAEDAAATAPATGAAEPEASGLPAAADEGAIAGTIAAAAAPEPPAATPPEHPAGDDAAEPGAAEDTGSPRRGWWQRTFGN